MSSLLHPPDPVTPEGQDEEEDGDGQSRECTGNSAHGRKELSVGTTKTSGLSWWAVCHPLTDPRPGCSRDSPGTLLSRSLRALSAYTFPAKQP